MKRLTKGQMIIFAIVLFLFFAFLFVGWANPELDAFLFDETGFELKHLLLALFLVIGTAGGISCIRNPVAVWKAGVWNWFFRDASPSRTGLFFIRGAGVFLLLVVAGAIVALLTVYRSVFFG